MNTQIFNRIKVELIQILFIYFIRIKSGTVCHLMSCRPYWSTKLLKDTTLLVNISRFWSCVGVKKVEYFFEYCYTKADLCLY
jgi:hypothetical protein